MKEPVDVSWSDHNYCYHGKCPECNKWLTFHNAWQPNEYDTEVRCEYCGELLDIKRWLRNK